VNAEEVPAELTLFIRLEHKHGPAAATVLREGLR
jgi:hypothetical protein